MGLVTLPGWRIVMRRQGIEILQRICVLSWLLAFPAAAIGDDGEHDFEVVRPADIYYGSGQHPNAPAVIEANKVWAEIPEYKKILEDELTDDDPEYHILMRKATERFEKALKTVAEREKYDMIGEVGSIKAIGEEKKAIPVATKQLIEVVSRD